MQRAKTAIGQPNRYIVLIAAAVINFVHGNPYIWTVFQPYVKAEYGLDTAMSSQPFTIIIGVFAIGNMLGGYLQHRIGARKTIFTGSMIMCAGFFIAASAPAGFPWMISAGYGFLGGIGSGCAFSMLVAVPQAWFPDKRGLVTGITIGIVGISGVIMNPFCDWMLSHYGYRFSMFTVTVIYAVLSFGGLWFVKEPDGGEESEEEIQEQKPVKNFTTKEMMHTKTYVWLSLSMALAVPAYVLVNPLMKSLGMERGLSAETALFGVLAASFANIIGRFAAAWISDRLGCKRVIMGLYVIAMVSVIGISVAKGGLFIVLISLVCLTYGGFVSLYSVLTAECFGMKYQGMNYGAAMIGYGMISVLCPYLIRFTEQTRFGLGLSFLIAGGACIGGMAATMRIKSGKSS